MELAELMQRIGNNNMLHYNIWFGEEQKIIDLYLKQLINNYKPIYCDTVKAALNICRTKSLDKSKKIYIVTEDSDFLKQETVWDNIKEMFNKSNNILILRYATLNKKNKFYTRNKQESVEFVHLQTEILINYIQKEINLSDNNCEKLCKMCNNDYGRILLEVDKIWQEQSFRFNALNISIESDIVFKSLLEQDAIYTEIGDITFELTDAILGGYPDKAIQKLDEAKRKGEPELRIISILYDGFRNLFAYKCLGKDKSNASQRTGLTGWQIKKCIDLDGGYTLQEVRRNMLLCQEVEVAIKTGKIDTDIALEYLTLQCLK